MNDKCTKMNKWRDENGNRKAARVVPAVGSAAHVQKNWMNTPQRAAGRRCRHESEGT